MIKLGLKMLIEDKVKFFGMILGLMFSSFIINQQAAIFIGLMIRTYGFISDTSQAKIWVMDKDVQFVEDIKPLKDTDLFRVRSIYGVKWAIPLFKGLIKARLSDGSYQNCIIVGLDENTFIGEPAKMVKGKVQDLRKVDAIIVDEVEAKDKLANVVNGKKVPLKIGDIIELNDHRAQVVGFCKSSRTFYSQPLIYTTYDRAIKFSPKERKTLSFILAFPKEGVPVKKVIENIKKRTSLAAYSKNDFEKLTINYYMRETGIPINFGVAVILGLIIGAAIAGQTFYNFVNDNMRYLALLKAIGVTDIMLLKITLLQALYVGVIGWGLGIGAAALFGIFSMNTDLSFYLPWQLFVFSGAAMLSICFASCFFSLKKIFKLEPAMVFKT